MKDGRDMGQEIENAFRFFQIVKMLKAEGFDKIYQDSKDIVISVAGKYYTFDSLQQFFSFASGLLAGVEHVQVQQSESGQTGNVRSEDNNSV